MQKDKFISNIKLKYIHNLAFPKQLSGICQSIDYVPVDFLKVCSIGTYPGSISVINENMYKGTEGPFVQIVLNFI